MTGAPLVSMRGLSEGPLACDDSVVSYEAGQLSLAKATLIITHSVNRVLYEHTDKTAGMPLTASIAMKRLVEDCSSIAVMARTS